MNEERISYEELRQIVFDYFKEKQGIQLSSISIDYLKNKMTGETLNNSHPFFVMKNEMGETRFDITKEDIQKIFDSYLADKGYKLTSIEYGYGVGFKYKQNPEIDSRKEEKIELDITYDGRMDYTTLRKMIFDYYKENKGIQLSSISIDYLKNKMTGETLNNSHPFFVMKNGMGETRFDISQEEMQEILKSYLSKMNYELTDLKFDSSVEFKYKQGKQHEKENSHDRTELGVKINEFGEIIRNVQGEHSLLQSNAPHFEPPKEKKEEYRNEPLPVKDQELERMVREKRKFTILQRERAMNDAQKAKNCSAIMAGICILGAAVAVYFNRQDINQVLQNELNAIYSWDTLGQYIQDLGPLTTLLTAGTGAFMAKYIKHSKKLKQAQNEFVDFNASLENEQILGGNENAKSR
ncbi:MAG: hypothetical protein RRY16_03255 [Bacilli bacterium]